MDDGTCYDCFLSWDDKKRTKKEKMPIEKRLATAGIGKRYINCTLDNFLGAESIVKYCREWINNPESIYFHGGFGCGKTHFAVAITRCLLEQDIAVLFVNASDIFLELRSCYSESGDEKYVVNKYASASVLIIDDLGADKTSDWSRAMMYLIIDKRDREMLPTIITSNLSPNVLSEQIDGRISSRIANGKIINIKLPDYRVKRKENNHAMP